MPTRRTMISSLAAGAALASLPAAARMRVERYTADAASLSAHPLPRWFDDAKLGIFIHWGLYSIPAFAPLGPNAQPAAPDMMRYNPYAEWYANTMQFPDSETAAYHRTHYGSAPYSDFAAPFEAAAARTDFAAWARTFSRAGARYVTLVTKHHDGFALWPSSTANPERPGWHSKTDIVGKLAAAVRAQEMRFGTYYSGGLDWSIAPGRVDNGGAMFRSMPGDDRYDAYVAAHYRELIARAAPDYLWNDIGYPAEASSFRLMADFYNGNPDGVINDRWQPARETFAGTPDEIRARLIAFRRALADHRPPPPKHYDVITPEYATELKPMEKKWEATRGIGFSFGYNAREADASLLSAQALIHLLVDCTARGGNLLLNVGPRGDGSLCPMQVARLDALGAFLRDNGEAIYATRPWHTPAATGLDGRQVRFTTRGRRVYAITLDGEPTWPRLAGDLPQRAKPLGPAGGHARAWRVR